ncbi:class I SAM-dependent methyltransferase [Stappia indica]|uniref:class I SAM-dependent methyltransferase n=1 Tax=Stappia indica TaxID=538381 RepID=UPI0009F7305A|nr:class I SAM-dependent methyltransferase [Stappia indica]
MEWYERFEMPPPGNVRHPGQKGLDDFIRIGSNIAKNVYGALAPHLPREPEGGLKVLDFGCGVGRVAMPLYHHYNIPSHGVDVSPWCVSVIKKSLTAVDIHRISPLPPTPFEDNTFDAVYAISVWTHLPLEMQWPLLREVNRILKLGGVALISTSGFRALSYRRDHRKQDGWRGVSDDDLRLEGVIYKDCDPKNNDGVGAKYGYVAHDPDWIRSNWGRLFEIVNQFPAGIDGMQDINLLRKVRDVPPSDVSMIGLEGGS